ncbi:hypothetical protein P9112_002191 [Eukaryota sp. TZLM1-RC]
MISLSCCYCNRIFDSADHPYVCPDHPGHGNLDVIIPKPNEPICDRPGMFRYLPMMPLNQEAIIPSVTVGDTPLVNASRLAIQLSLSNLYFKDDGRNPTGSLKDRASAFVCSKALSQNISTIATASTGNAGAALAGIGASCGVDTIIYVPASAPIGKLAQSMAFGSKVITVDGTYDDAFKLCDQACKQHGYYNRNTGFNPYTVEGKKTVSFEIAEQLGGGLGSGAFQVPDWVAVSVGDGNIIAGVFKGFKDLFDFGLIDRMPRLLAVQAAGSPFVYECVKNNEDPATKEPVKVSTIADSVAAGVPADKIRAVRAVKQTSGDVVLVPEEKILTAITDVAAKVGVFAEPAAALSYAGLEIALEQGIVKKGSSVVVLITGNGLKDIKTVIKATGDLPSPIPPLS